MSASVVLPKNDPRMIAWKAYQETDEYKNTRKWALVEAHVDGSLWAAFETGFRAAVASHTPSMAEKESELAKLREENEQMRAALEKIIRADDTGPMIYQTRENGPSQAIGSSEGRFAALARAAIKEQSHED